MRFFFRRFFCVFLVGLSAMLAGCTTVAAVTTAAKIANVALESVGLKKPDAPELPESLKPPRNVALKLHAGTNLNAGASEKPLSVVTRLYKLKQTAAFYSASYEVFLSAEKEKTALGQDLLDVREVSLVPGQLYEITEKVSRESGYIGVVTLFRTPAPERWRVAFVAQEAELAGIRIGLHACSLTIGQGAAREPGNNVNAPTVNSPSKC